MSSLRHVIGTPILAIEIISPIFKDKVVCELGCGGGNIMEVFLKYGAKECIGVEHRPELVQKAKDKGLNVIEGDINDIELPVADVYYNWTPLPTFTNILKKIQNGIVVCGYMPWANKELDQYNSVRIIVPGYASSEKDSTVFELTIINNDYIRRSITEI